MKITPNSKTTPGDIQIVKCKTHGAVAFIAGIHFSVDEVPPSECPHCRHVETGKWQVGQGFIDSKGVAYIVDIFGNIRQWDKLTEVQKERIQGRKELLKKGRR
jgi:hypothetical protein